MAKPDDLCISHCLQAGKRGLIGKADDKAPVFAVFFKAAYSPGEMTFSAIFFSDGYVHLLGNRCLTAIYDNTHPDKTGDAGGILPFAGN